MQLVIGSTYESSRGFGRLLYLGETHGIDGYLPTFRTSKGEFKHYRYDQLPGALVDFAAPTVSRAEELIACLEGEIAKRDARIVELEGCKAGLESDVARLREKNATFSAAWDELAAIKAQEPVAWTDGAGAMYSASLMASLNISSGGLTPLYAAPVSEAKAQGVAMPDERSAFEKWGETLFFKGCFERHENDEYAGRGLQGAWLGWQARAALDGEPARLCVLPDGWKLVPVEPTLDMGWAYVDAANEAIPGKRNSFNHSGYRAMLAVAPKAPTVESGLVEALTTVARWHLPETGQFWPSGGPISYEAQYGSNGARDYMRGVAQAALAAHRAKGVV